MRDDFKNIWSSYYPRILRYVASFSGLSDTDREDCVQEIFFSIYDKLDSYNKKWAFSTWIYRIARNRLIDYQRIQKRRASNSLPELHAEAAGKNLSDTETELSMDIERAVANLEDQERELIHLYYYEDYRIKEIAAILRIPPGTVKSRLIKIRGTLKLKL